MSSLIMPSGRVFDDRDQTIARGFALNKVVEYRPGKSFKLKSGILSEVYVNGRDDLTSDHALLHLVAQKAAEVAAKMQRDHTLQRCYIGLPTAGTGLATWTAAADVGACFYIMRENKKEGYGAHNKWVVGPPRHDRHEYFKIDNVVTDGGTKAEKDAQFAEDGYSLPDMHDIIMVDRQMGGLERMRSSGANVRSLYNLLDLAAFFHKDGFWPAEAVRGIEKEIEEHGVKA